MKKCGESIAFHRKRLNLTQTELGEKLNVTAQAVSKWENDISEPDLVTVQRLCKIFGISADELLNWPGDEAEEGGEAAEAPPAEETAAADAAAEEVSAAADAAAEEVSAAEAAPAADPAAPASASTASAPAAAPAVVVVPAAAPAPAAAAPAPAAPPKVIVGYCDECKRPIYQGEPYDVVHHARSSRQEIYCRACTVKRGRRARSYEYETERTRFNRSWIWGGVAGGVTALLFIILPLVAGENLLFGGLAFAVMAFTFTTQCFWGELVSDIFFFFCKSFRMPGVIFTLDLDGIIWLITVKLFLAILSGLLSVLLFLFGLVFTLVFSLFAFPFSLIAEIHKLKKLKAAVK